MVYNEYAVRGPRNATPVRLQLMRGCTVLMFGFVFLNVLGWNQTGDDRPELPAASVAAANRMLDDMVVKARTAGTKYTYDVAAADLDQLAALSGAFQGYRGLGITDHDGSAQAQSLRLKLDYTHDEIGLLALHNSGVKERGAMVEAYYSSDAVHKYRQQHGETPAPTFVPPIAHQDINWHHVAKRGIDGWLLAMIPAFLTILVSFRLRRESLWAELVERPWGPVLATICWPFGLWVYVGQPGVIERRLAKLRQAFEEDHHCAPSEEWLAAQRLVLMRRARDTQHALAQIREYPELIRVNSRSAILASWLVAMMSGPLSMMLGVVQAYAQVAKASGGVDSSLVDTSRIQRRRFRGFTDGNIETSSDGQRLGTSGHLRGKLTFGEDGLFIHVDPTSLKLIEGYATTQLGHAQLMAGMIVPYAVFDYPAPWDALFRTSQGFNLLPAFADFGLQGETRAGPMTVQAGILTGDGVGGQSDNRTDAELRLATGHGALSASASYQGGDRHRYYGGNASLAGSLGSLNYEYARRLDDDPQLAGNMHQLEVIGRYGSWRLGCQAATASHRTMLGVLERKLGGFKRLMVECLAMNGQAPRWTLRFQQGLKVATP